MTDVNLQDRVAVVTGASRGIGRAVALGLAKAGAHVIAIARTEGAVEELDDEIQSLGGTATLLPLDLTKFLEVDKIGPALYERFGRCDIFVGNAGTLGPLTPAHQVEPKDWEKTMRVNFAANTRLIRTLDPMLRASDAGRVVFTGATITDNPLAYWGPYVSSKAALETFAKTYAAETKRTNLRVNIIRPPAVDTAMLAKAFPGGFPGRCVKPEDIVSEFLDLCDPTCSKHGEIVAL